MEFPEFSENDKNRRFELKDKLRRHELLSDTEKQELENLEHKLKEYILFDIEESRIHFNSILDSE